jgi:hypothetical protein
MLSEIVDNKLSLSRYNTIYKGESMERVFVEIVDCKLSLSRYNTIYKGESMERVFVETVAIDGICEIIIREGLSRKKCIVQLNAAFLLFFEICEKKTIDQLYGLMTH